MLTQLFLAVAIFVICWLVYREFSLKKQIKDALDVIKDIQAGNLDRRIVVTDNNRFSQLLYKVNEIVIQQKHEQVLLLQSEKRYRELTTSLSHDIRTPVASLTGYLSAIQDGVITEDEKQIYFKKAVEKSNLVSESINDLFDWLKIESGEWEYHLKTLNFTEFIRETLADWIPKFEENQLSYTIDIPDDSICALLDMKALNRILDNLFNNIIIHSQATKISVRLVKSVERLQLNISDNGIGIPAKDLPFIFERQYKGDTSRNTRGTGLGLSIVNELVKAMQGTIHASSNENTGTTFQLSFKTC